VIDDAKRELDFHAIALFGYLKNFVNPSKVAGVIGEGCERQEKKQAGHTNVLKRA
jgi:hypothetical protein